MKNLLKRTSAGLLALFMVISLLVGVIPAETYAASYTYNTGTRHDYNVELSNQAEAYYTGDYTWDKLSNLNGGNENCLDMNNPLFKALHNLMTTTMTNSVSYKSLPDYWKYTDASGGSAGTIWFYADNTVSDSMSREHVWPKSHASFHEKNGGADLHHLRPSINNINSSRSALIMGNVKNSGGKAWSYNGDVVLYKTSTMCEVNDNIKGDVARIFLYVWCRWEEPNLFKNTPNPVVGPSDEKNDGVKVIESLETLLEWCAIDPVDTWEMSRNDQVQNIQGNRNVFIDYPEFAWLVFGQDVPTDLNTPSNNASGGISGKPSEGGNTGSGNTGNSSGSTTNSGYTQISSLSDGDKVVIVNPASNMALSTTKVATYYNAGVDVSSGFGSISDAETFTAKKNSDGSWSFTSADGKKLAMAAEYSSLDETGVNDKWTLSNAGNNQFYLLNTGRDLYLEWYASKNNWSAYKPDSLNADYILAFYTKTVAGDSTGGSTGDSTGGSTGGNTSGSTGGTTTTTPPATQPPVTQPPATQPPVTQPPATQPSTSEGTQTSTPATQPGNSEGTQTSTPATQPGQPAPLPMVSVNPDDFIQKDESNNGNTLVIILAIAAGAIVVGAIVVYFVVIKPKKNAIAIETPVEENTEDTTEENE